MKTFLIFLLCSLCALVNAKPSSNAIEDKNNLKIIDGLEVAPHSMPYMVAIKTVINDNDVLCGGSLLSTRLVLTSAMCVSGATEAEVILGAHNIEDTAEGHQTLKSSEFIIHEEFDPIKIHNDIALIQLPQAVELNDKIQTINLPDVTDILNFYDDKLVTVAGWGRTSDASQDTSKVLRYQTFTTIPFVMCEISYLLNIRPTQICTSGVSKKNICRGDSGSPLVFNGTQIGIASYGSTFGCSIGFPGVYTRITSYLSWLLLSMP